MCIFIPLTVFSLKQGSQEPRGHKPPSAVVLSHETCLIFTRAAAADTHPPTHTHRDPGYLARWEVGGNIGEHAVLQPAFLTVL